MKGSKVHATTFHDKELFFRGPALDKGPLPTIFYFALSGSESLSLNPINRPVEQFLSSGNTRAFSWNLPYHPPGRSPNESIQNCSDELLKGHDFLTPFLEESKFIISKLLEQGLVLPAFTSFAGLSRGAFFASHLIAQFNEIKPLLGFAPMTVCSPWMGPISPLAEKFSLFHLSDALSLKSLRLYIGHDDERVGTTQVIKLFQSIANCRQKHKTLDTPLDLILRPSIGYKGHGTSDQTFDEGADWLRSMLA